MVTPKGGIYINLGLFDITGTGREVKKKAGKKAAELAIIRSNSFSGDNNCRLE
jgi:hypothetical protein